MEIRFMDEKTKEKYRANMIEMMVYSNHEFVPPLSSRASTTEKHLTGEGATSEDILPYFNEMFKQEFLGAFEGEKIVGYLSYRLDYTTELIGQETLPNVYMSTLISRPEARGQGMSGKLYAKLIQETYPDRNIYTRTWSTNFVQLHQFLDRYGFRVIRVIKDDRGPGVDTVYFERPKLP